MSRHEDIKLLRINYLRGPNMWTYRPVLETWLDLGRLEDFPSNQLPGFTERLTGRLPALIEHHCGVGERGGFLQRLTEGTWMGHVLEHIVIELLNLAGMPTGFGQTRSYTIYRATGSFATAQQVLANQAAFSALTTLTGAPPASAFTDTSVKNSTYTYFVTDGNKQGAQSGISNLVVVTVK